MPSRFCTWPDRVGAHRTPPSRRELTLKGAINRLDRFDLMILDDLAYVTKDQAETSVLFELISARYERRSMLITANQPRRMEQGLPGPRYDPRRHRSPRSPRHIEEMNAESYRRRTALERKRGPGRRHRTRHPKLSLIDAPRQSEFNKTLLRAYHRGNHHHAATHRLAILIVALPTQIVALEK